MTEIIAESRLPDRLPIGAAGSAITVGTFDGVHKGHLAVIAELRRTAEALGAKSVLVSFEPHPLTVVRPEAAPLLLTPHEEKRELLARCGLDYVVFLPFTRELADYPPRRFVEEILIDRLGLRHLVIGYDHGFGKGRSGDVDSLRSIGAEVGFDVDVVPVVLLEGAPISSTRIRKALAAGDVDLAARALGRPYTIRGEVVRGEARGRKLGFPTANIHISEPEKFLPGEGIYAVRSVVGGQVREGVLHLGPRPTYEGAAPTVELHLFDFDQDIYGTQVTVDFCAWIRGIEAFDSEAALIQAIDADCMAARRLFSEGRTACQDVSPALE